jgi:hypothetical protein
VTVDPSDALDRARRDSGLTGRELWLRYFALGGMTDPLQLEAALCGALRPADHDYDQIAHALNERFTELGRNHPVPYRSTDGSSDPGS